MCDFVSVSLTQLAPATFLPALATCFNGVSQHFRSTLDLTWNAVPIEISTQLFEFRWSRWPCCLRNGSAAARLLGSRVWIPLRAWMFGSCVCYVGSGLCDELTACSEKSYRVCVCLMLCDLETSTMRQPKAWLVGRGRTPPQKSLNFLLAY
jgi:hypothetical protein